MSETPRDVTSILVVDDEESLRLTFQLFLTAAGI